MLAEKLIDIYFAVFNMLMAGGGGDQGRDGVLPAKQHAVPTRADRKLQSKRKKEQSRGKPGKEPAPAPEVGALEYSQLAFRASYKLLEEHSQ